MLRIGEFSYLSSISIAMLRHYDKIGLLMPEYVDSISGYRYYDKVQLVQANRIVALKEMGLGLDEIKTMMHMNQDDVDMILKNKLKIKQSEISSIQTQINRIQLAINKDKTVDDYALSIATKIIPELLVVSLRGEISDYKDEGLLWGKLQNECKTFGVKVADDAMAMAIYYECDDKTEMLDVEVLLSLDKKYSEGENIKIYIMPRCEVASVVFRGSYTKIGDINSFVAEWLEKNKFKIAGKPFSIYHNSPANQSMEKDFVTELCFPIINSKKCVDTHIV